MITESISKLGVCLMMSVTFVSGCGSKKKPEKTDFQAIAAALAPEMERLRATDASIRPDPGTLDAKLKGDLRANLTEQSRVVRACSQAGKAMAAFEVKVDGLTTREALAALAEVHTRAKDFAAAVGICEGPSAVTSLECPLRCVAAWGKVKEALTQLRTSAAKYKVDVPDVATTPPEL